MSVIPAIDFASCGLHKRHNVSEKNKKEAGKLVVDALSGLGFAYLKNTGMDSNLIKKAFEVFKLLFQESTEDKKKYPLGPTYHGFNLIGEENVNPKERDFKESFTVNCAIQENEKLYPWPDDLSPDFSKVIKDFLEQCRSLTVRVLEVIAVGMDLKDKDYLIECHSLVNTAKNLSALRGTFYPILENALPGQIRLGEHSDYGTVTLLFQDDIGGLQVKTPEGNYIDAKPIPDTVVLNIGDTLQFWTKHKLKSTKHRVVFPSDEEKRSQTRQSIAYFAGANNDTVIDEIDPADKSAESVKSENKEPMTAMKYMMAQLDRIKTS